MYMFRPKIEAALMATGCVTSSWAASFCLGCDNQAYGSDYCSERCHLKDQEHNLMTSRSDSFPRRRDERRCSLPGSVRSSRPSLALADPQVSLPRCVDSSKRIAHFRGLECSRQPVLMLASHENYTRNIRLREEETVPRCTSSSGGFPERRVVNVPRTENVATSTDWDIWRTRKSSLAIETEEITMRLQAKDSGDDV
ncbi:hypothetical protein VCV18_011026 [Metarhizium anisopliae]